MYLLRLALRPWRDAPLSQVFSAMAVGFLLVLIGVVLWMQQGLIPVVSRLRGEQVLTAYLDPAADTKTEAKIVDSIRVSLGASPSADVNLVRPEDFIANLKPQYPDLAKELEDLGPETSALVPRYVSVAGVLPADALENVRSVPGVESVETSKDRYKNLIGAFSTLRAMLALLAAGLALALLTGLMHLSRMNAHLLEGAVSVMRLFGAPSWTARCPNFLSGLAVGAAAGGFAVLGWLTLGLGVSRHMRELSSLLRDMPAAPVQGGLVLFGVALFAGIASGVAGSLLSAPGRKGARV